MKEALCRFSRPEDVERMKELWQLCFGDEEAYIQHYFETYYRPQRALVLEAEDQICSMLLLFSFFMTLPDGTQQKASYIYAFCTHPQYQSKGYGRLLLRYAEELAQKEGCTATIMVPGEESLFRFYHSLGYEDGAFLTERILFPEPFSGSVNPCGVERYAALRERYLTGTAHISYDSETLAYQLRLCQASEGGFYELDCGIAAAETEDGTLFLKELLSPHPQQAASALMAHLGCHRAILRQRGTERPFAVIKWLKSDSSQGWEQTWLAFAFD